MNQSSGVNNGKASCMLYDISCSGLSIDESSSTINDNNWHFVTFTKSHDTLRIYIDCLLEVTFNDATTCSSVNTDDLFIGKKGGSQPNYLTGIIDDLSIYNCALTINEICNLYTNVKEIDNLNNSVVNIYPNPSQTLSIKLEKSFNSLVIIDVNGKEVLFKDSLLNKDQLNVDVSYLPNGVYFIKLTSEDEVITKKWMKN